MKKLLLFPAAFLLLILVLSNCSPSPEQITSTTRILERDGYSQVEITGYRALGCSDDDVYKLGFKAKKNNESVEGVVCSGFYKGATIRVLN